MQEFATSAQALPVQPLFRKLIFLFPSTPSPSNKLVGRSACNRRA